jgi:conjugal transfer pilus assembly protein TraL
LKPVYVPKYLDEPPKFLLWTYPQFVCLCAPFLLGLMIKQMLWGLLVSVILMWVLRQCKQMFKDVNVMSLLYWHLPHQKIFQNLPQSYIREYLG